VHGSFHSNRGKLHSLHIACLMGELEMLINEYFSMNMKQKYANHTCTGIGKGSD